jgi:hypothetical protein
MAGNFHKNMGDSPVTERKHVKWQKDGRIVSESGSKSITTVNRNQGIQTGEEIVELYGVTKKTGRREWKLN